MINLGFVLPSSSRFIFPSLEIKLEWEGKLKQVRDKSSEIEMISVHEGLRDFALQTISNFDEEHHQALLDKYELVSEIVYYSPYQSGFVHTSTNHSIEPIDGNYLKTIVVYKKKDLDLSELVNAVRENDNSLIGKKLGFPECCIEFFNKTASDGIFDPIWQHAIASSEGSIKRKEDYKVIIGKDASLYLNTMLRALNVRFLPYIPCSFDCECSTKKVEKYAEAIKKHLPEEFEIMEAVAKLPLEWSCFKGIAYINSPIFKFEYSSIACVPEYKVQKEGSFYPPNAPVGNKFPWTEKWKINGSLIQQMKLK